MMIDKNKILLIRPENIYRLNNYPSLALLTIATTLFHAGFEPVIINCALEQNLYSAISRELPHALMVGVTMTTAECPSGYPILKHIRSLAKDIPIVVGGWHARLFPKQMADSPLVDYVVIGDGEMELLRLAEAFRYGQPFKPGILYYHRFANMNDSWLTRYSLDPKIEHFINSDLTDPLSRYMKRPMRWLPYESSRGCPGECRFCCNVVADNRRWRAKQAGRVATEIGCLAGKYKIQHVKVIDDNFFVDIERVRAICENLLMLGINVTWDAECRADYFRKDFLDHETLSLCKRAGLVQLTLGIESGSQSSLDLMKKHLAPEQAEYAVAQCNEHEITARCSFIIELPGERREDIEQTRRFIKRLKRYPYFTCGVQTFRPYPRCELTRDLIASGQWNEPQDFESWCNPKYVRQFTAAQARLPWQVQPKRSVRMAGYQYLESGTTVVPSVRSRWLYRILRRIACWRNAVGFYGCPLDLWFFERIFQCPK